MNPEDELLKKRQSVLDVGQRNQYEGVQTEVRRNNEALTSLRRENKELRNALQQSQRGQRNVSIEDHYTKEEELLHNKMSVLRRSLNAVKGKNVELAKEIEKTREENQFVQGEGAAAVVDESSTVAKKIRALENRLDKCLIKHNEVNAIRRTYETLLERLRLEQAGFDTQLGSTEKALLSAERELQELGDVGQQASKGRDQVHAEVARLKSKLQEDRRAQAKDLEQRHGFIQDKRDVLEKKHNTILAKMAQQEERHARTLQTVLGGGGTTTSRRRLQDADRSITSNGGALTWLSSLSAEELEELHRQKEAYLHLRDATMSSCVGEVVQRVRERQDNHQQLQQSAVELEAAVDASKETRKRLQTNWEEQNQRAGGAMVSAKVTRNARDANAVRHNNGAGASDSDDDDAVGGAGADADYGLLASRVRQNRNILAEFAGHLRERKGQLEDAQKSQDALSQLITGVEAGVQHLGEKVSVLRVNPMAAITTTTSGSSNSFSGTGIPVMNFAALLRDKGLGEAALASAADSVDLLRSCDSKMQVMLDEMSLEEVEAVAQAMHTARVLVPATNVRLVGLTNRGTAEGGAAAAGGMGHAAAHGTSAASSPSASMYGKLDGGTAASGMMGGNTNSMAAAGGTGGALAATTGAQFDDFPESEIHDRRELKLMSMATVEREELKLQRRRMAARRKEETS